jgi:hypothetical protein
MAPNQVRFGEWLVVQACPSRPPTPQDKPSRAAAQRAGTADGIDRQVAERGHMTILASAKNSEHTVAVKTYSDRVDRKWMRAKLLIFVQEVREYEETLGSTTTHIWKQRQGVLGELRMQERTVKEILKVLDPALAEFNLDDDDFGPLDARNKAQYGLGILVDQEEWASRLAPETPTLAADQFHPWVWESARSLWNSNTTDKRFKLLQRLSAPIRRPSSADAIFQIANSCKALSALLPSRVSVDSS